MGLDILEFGSRLHPCLTYSWIPGPSRNKEHGFASWIQFTGWIFHIHGLGYGELELALFHIRHLNIQDLPTTFFRRNPCLILIPCLVYKGTRFSVVWWPVHVKSLQHKYITPGPRLLKPPHQGQHIKAKKILASFERSLVWCLQWGPEIQSYPTSKKHKTQDNLRISIRANA